MTYPEDVLGFWLDEVGPAGWYGGGAALDEAVRERFGDAWEQSREGAFDAWLCEPRGALAFIILTDQFPRNMFRDRGEAFASDAAALAAAKAGIGKGWDLRTDSPERQFFYLPLMHSESLADQDRCVRLMKTRLQDAPDNLLHARAHREVIRRFGRFPYRNAALGRATTAAERAFLEAGGYGAAMEKVRG